MQAVPSQIVKDAFIVSGEKHYAIARLCYSLLLGPQWQHGLLCFAYFKRLDNLVDEDPSAERALALLASQRQLMARAYAGDRLRDTGLHDPLLNDLGHRIFGRDRVEGSRQQSIFESVIETMEFDSRRRGTTISRAALEAYVLKLGKAVISCLAGLVAPHVGLAAPLIEESSRAYLYADSLVDLEHDLRMGIINVPVEDIRQYGLTLDISDGRLRTWWQDRAGDTLGHFARAVWHANRLEDFRLKALTHFYLRRKRRQLLRFLAREGMRCISPMKVRTWMDATSVL